MAKIIEVIVFGKYLYFLKESELKRLLVLSFGILRAQTVNISLVNDQIPLEESGRLSRASQYNYLLKTFQTGNVEKTIRQVFNILVVLFYKGEAKVKLLIDRTNWEIGDRKVNILSIGLLYDEKIYIPLLGEDLGYKGNSDSETRINLVDKLLEWWKSMQIPVPQFVIVGDREFIGEEWLTALAKREIEYVIRLKGNLKFETWLKGRYKIGKKFGVKVLHRYMESTNEDVELVLSGEAIAQLYIVKNEGKLAKKEPYLYLITNQEDIDLSGTIYKQRWKIETCFSYLKSKGLNLEQLNLEGTHKTDILFAILSLVYGLIVFQGQESQKEDPPKQIEYNNGTTYPRISVFRQGLRELTGIATFDQFLEHLERIFRKTIQNWQMLNQLYIKNLSG